MNASVQLDLRDCHQIASRSTVRRGGWQDSFSRTLQKWRARRADRRVLALLSERDFHDMGRSRSELAYELAKPFWRG